MEPLRGWCSLGFLISLFSRFVGNFYVGDDYFVRVIRFGGFVDLVRNVYQVKRRDTGDGSTLRRASGNAAASGPFVPFVSYVFFVGH